MQIDEGIDVIYCNTYIYWTYINLLVVKLTLGDGVVSITAPCNYFPILDFFPHSITGDA